MSGQWKQVPISTKLFTNVKEAVLRRASAAIENAFINEADGHTRFPGLVEFATLSGVAPTYLSDWKGDLVAVSNSRVYRVDSNAVVTDVTGVPLSGFGRPTFDKTTDELVIAAGGPILRLAEEVTEILSDDAPLSTHVAFIDDFLLAIEVGTGNFKHCASADFRSWDPLDTFAANGKPDQLNGLIITPYREIILTGADSVEQFERLTGGSTPFFRRWSVGEGIMAPYTLVAEDQGTFGVNSRAEFIRMTGQVSEPRSDDIGRTLEGVDDWTDAWTESLLVLGQKFILLQIPNATNVYGTKGITMIYEYRGRKWQSLYGWNSAEGKPDRWPGWSYMRMWGRHFVGGNGKIFELVDTAHTNDGETQRMLGRTGHIDEWGKVMVNNVRARLVRGVAASSDPDAPMPEIRLRCVRDNKHSTRWIGKNMGRPGDKHCMVDFGPMGSASTWQFEWEVTSDVPVEFVALEAQLERVSE